MMMYIKSWTRSTTDCSIIGMQHFICDFVLYIGFLFGVEPSNPDPLGTWMTRIHPEDLDQVQQAIDQCAKQGGVEVAYRYQHPDRGRRWILSKARTMQHTDGRDRIFGVSIDITRVKRLEEDLRQVRDDLERRVRARTAQLSRTVEALHAEVAQRVEAEEALQNRSQQLRLLSTELTLAEQKERQRMSQVLHDGLQQLLVGTRFQLATEVANQFPTRLPWALQTSFGVCADAGWHTVDSLTNPKEEV